MPQSSRSHPGSPILAFHETITFRDTDLSPSSHSPSMQPRQPSRVVKDIARGLNKLALAGIIPKMELVFFASKKLPKSGVYIEPVLENRRLNKDFSKQLKLAESVFGLDKQNALGESRSSFWSRFIRLSAEFDVTNADSAKKPRSVRVSQSQHREEEPRRA